VQQQSALWAERVRASRAASTAARISIMLREALGREPEAEEVAMFERLVSSLAELHGVSPGEVLSSQPVWTDVAHTLFNLKELIYIP
jgi:hypothetical protein